MFNILGQTLTFVSYVVFWISRFCKKKRYMLLYDNISRLIAIIAFIFLGSFNAIENTIFCMVRNITGEIVSHKSIKEKTLAFLSLLFTMICMYGMVFEGKSTIILMICSILNLTGAIFCKEQGIRLFGLAGSGFYLWFLALINNYIGSICEIICAMVMLISYLKYKKNR